MDLENPNNNIKALALNCFASISDVDMCKSLSNKIKKMLSENLERKMYWQTKKILEEKTGCETKTVLLGYVQRGGSPTAGDRVLASRLGFKVSELIEQESESSAVGIKGDVIVSYPIEEALKMKKTSHSEFIAICNALL